MKNIKTLFITGLVILLPLAVTLGLVVFAINFLTHPFVGMFEHYIEEFSWFKQHPRSIHFLLQLLFLTCLFFFIVLLGFLTRALFFKTLLTINDYIIHRIPFIKTVYKASQQVIRGILGTSSRSFKQVVMVPFPNKGVYSIGLVSGNAPRVCLEAVDPSLITVFVPTTPNPTSGFLMLYKKEDVIYTDMKIEDALKYVISCGVISSDEAHDRKSQEA